VAQLDGRTIPIVENESLIALDLMAILQSEGADVFAAMDLQEAFAVARQTELSAAILDINLGHIGHRGDCAPICRMLDQRHVPSLFHTGYRLGGVLDEFPKASVLVKPATKVQLLDCLNGVLSDDKTRRRYADALGGRCGTA
jgi:CheY-like chemotaxis protein